MAQSINLDRSPSLWSKVVAAFFLVIMSVQILALDGGLITYPMSRVVGMSLSPVVLLTLWNTFRQRWDCLFMIVLYLCVMLCCSLLASSSFSIDRIGYRALFLFSFLCFFQVVHTGDIPIEYICRVLCVIICAYGVVELVQQVAILMGHPAEADLFINFTGFTGRYGHMSKPNSLASEVSHLGRILSCHYWAVLVLTELINGRRMSFVEHFKENPFTTIAFWGTMIFCGSTTAMIGLAIIALHFIGHYKILYLVAVIAFVLFLSIDINFESVHRMQVVIRSLLSDDASANIIAGDSSAAVRIVRMINTFGNLDLFSLETWIGRGIDNITTIADLLSTRQYIGDITDFGLITYLVSLVLVYKCCIRRFFCMETLLFAILFTFSIGSIYTVWAALMSFTVIKHYTETYKPEMVESGEFGY